MQARITQGDVAKGAGTALIARAGGVVEVVSQPAYTLMFGLTTYGLYTVLWALVNLVENIADLGMTSALQRVVPQAADEAEASTALRYAMLLGIVPCLLIAAGACLGAPWIAEVINVAPDDRAHLVTGIMLFAWALPLWAFIEIGTSALRARRVFGPEIRLRIFWEQIIRFVLAIGFWLGGVDTLGLLLAHLGSLFITAIATGRMLMQHYELSHPFAPTRRLRQAVLLSGASVLPGNVVARLFGDAPAVILNLLLPGANGAIAAGLFGIVRKLSSIVQLVRMTFSYVMAPLASASHRHDRRGMEDIYGFAVRLSTALAMPLAGTMIGGGSLLLSFFGKHAQVAVPALIALLTGRLLEAIIGPAGSIQQVIAPYRHPVIASIAGFVVAIGTGMLLVPLNPLLGIAIAVSVGTLVTAGLPVVQLFRHEQLFPFAQPFGLTLFRTSMLGLIALMLGRLASKEPMAIALLLLVVTLLGATWLSLRYALVPQDKHALGHIAVRLRLWRGAEQTDWESGRGGTGTRAKDRGVIAIATYDFRSSGTVAKTVEIAAALKDAAIPVEIWAVRAKGPMLERVPAGIRIVSPPGEGGIGDRGIDLAWNLPRLVWMLRRHAPAVLLSSGNHLHLVAQLALLLSGLRGRTRLGIRASNSSQRLRRSGGTLRRRIAWFSGVKYAGVDFVVAVSEELAEEVRHIQPRANVGCIPNGVDVNRVQRLAAQPDSHPFFEARRTNPDVAVIISMGRLSRQKGFDVLIRAFAELRQSREARLILIGDGPAAEREALEALARELGVTDDLSLLGYRKNPFSLLAQADLYVCASRWEGASNALLEALACGLPLVATDCPTGNRELLRDGRNGTLAPVEDPEALAAAMLAQLDRPADRDAQKAAAREFDLAICMDRWKTLLSAQLEQTRVN